MFGGDPGPTVAVVRGTAVAPAGLRQGDGPPARYVADSDVVAFVSAPLFSGSCPPTAEAEQEGDGTLLLTVDSPGGECTADANPYTFLVQGFSGVPTRLVVEGAGERRIVVGLEE